MTLLSLIVALILIGAALAIVPMEERIKRAIVVVVLVVVALMLLRAFLPDVRL